MSQQQAACKLNMSQSTLCRILKSWQKIENASLENYDLNRKRKRDSKEEVEELWNNSLQKRKSFRVTGPLLRQKSKDLKKKWTKMILWQQYVRFTMEETLKHFVR